MVFQSSGGGPKVVSDSGSEGQFCPASGWEVGRSFNDGSCFDSLVLLIEALLRRMQHFGEIACRDIMPQKRPPVCNFRSCEVQVPSIICKSVQSGQRLSDIQRKPPPRNPHGSWGWCEWRPPHKQRLETGRAGLEAENGPKIGGAVFAFPPKPRQHWASRAHEKGQSKSGPM